MNVNRAVTAVLLALLASCHPAVAVAPRALTPVASLATHRVQSLVELDGNTYVFDDAGVTVVRAGAVVARDDFPASGQASTIAAPDGEGRWVMSALRRITPDGDTAMINEERLGLPVGVAWTVYGAGPTTVAMSARGLAVAGDGHHVSLFPPSDATSVAVARGRVALANGARLDVWDLAAGTSRSYPLANAHVAFVDADATTSRLVAWTPSRLAVEGNDGALHAIATPAPIAGAAASGKRLWVLADGHVSYLDPSATTLAPTTIGAARIDQIFGSPSGDVWTVAGGKLERYAIAAPTGDPTWAASVSPVFARVCAHCHLPDGSSGVDLSTPAEWHDERAEIKRRVVVARSMPPAGTAMSDDDRAAIAAWVDGTAPPFGGSDGQGRAPTVDAK